jgi:hypothetical protein
VATYCRTAVTPVSAEEGLTGQLVGVSSLGFAGRGQSPYIWRPYKKDRNRFPAWRSGTTTLFVVQARQVT